MNEPLVLSRNRAIGLATIIGGIVLAALVWTEAAEANHPNLTIAMGVVLGLIALYFGLRIAKVTRVYDDKLEIMGIFGRKTVLFSEMSEVRVIRNNAGRRSPPSRDVDIIYNHKKLALTFYDDSDFRAFAKRMAQGLSENVDGRAELLVESDRPWR